MKLLSKIFALTLAMICSVSCDFLDVVPDERTTDTDTYAGRNNGIDYLYSCYAYLPNPSNTPGGLDLLTGDEVITAFEHETFAAFPKGNYSASSPVISYWNTFFQGIRQCYMFMERIDRFPDTTDAEKNDYRAQAKFLIAYYHFLLSRAYGPILLIKETPSTDILASEYPTRVPYDECVAWICDLLDEAAKDLPAKRDIKNQYGLATSIMAKSVKAKMLLYAASPLFNGNSAYAGFKDKEGVALMPASYDAQKWMKARDALMEAIKLAESNGHSLYVNDAYRGEDGKQVPGERHRATYAYPDPRLERRSQPRSVVCRHAGRRLLRHTTEMYAENLRGARCQRCVAHVDHAEPFLYEERTAVG